MAKKKAKKKLSVLTLAMLVVAVVGVALSVTGWFLDWTVVKTDTIIGGGESSGMTLQDWAELNDLGELTPENSVLMQAFAWCAGIVAIVGLVVLALKALLKSKLLGTMSLIVGALAVICGIVAIIVTFVAAQSYLDVQVGDIVKSTCQPAVGAWLTTAGSIVAGAAAVVGSRK